METQIILTLWVKPGPSSKGSLKFYVVTSTDNQVNKLLESHVGQLLLDPGLLL